MRSHNISTIYKIPFFLENIKKTI